MLTPKGTIAGKHIVVYDSGGKRRVTPAQLRTILRKHPTNDTLRRLGQASGTMWQANKSAAWAADVPVPAHALPYLALLSIEASNDYRGHDLTDEEFIELVRMFYDLDEPLLSDLGEDEKGAVSFLLRAGRQFDFQGELRHQLPRTVLLLRDTWPRVKQAAAISPLEDLERITRLSFDQLLFFGWAYAGASASGFFRPYSEGPTPLFSIAAQDAFLRWISADYSTIRQLVADAKKMLPNESFDPFRFNPLTVFPAIRPDQQPDPRNGPVYLVPSQRLLFERVHRGLYHVLADHHRGESDGENPFRVAFGFVFQEYVGELLRRALGAEHVIAERTYREGPSDVQTVDWIVVEGDRGVLVEVKQSTLSLPAKTLGDLARARADTKKSLAKAMRQIERTEAAIRRRVSGLEDLAHISEFEHLVVTYDTLYWANAFLRDLAVAEFGTNPPHVHASAIEDFEYVLGRAEEGLTNLLSRKRTGPNGEDHMDFDDWLSYEDGESGRRENPFLSERYHKVFRDWGVSQNLNAWR